MNFLGVGPLELIVILVVALVFVGPERLPKLAADIARTIREVRKYTGGLAAEFNEVIQDFEKDTEGERSAWKEIETGITGATKSVTEAVRDARSELQGAHADASAPVANAVAPVPADSTVPSETPAWSDIASGPPSVSPDTPASTNGTHAASGVAPSKAATADEAR